MWLLNDHDRYVHFFHFSFIKLLNQEKNDYAYIYEIKIHDFYLNLNIRKEKKFVIYYWILFFYLTKKSWWWWLLVYIVFSYSLDTHNKLSKNIIIKQQQKIKTTKFFFVVFCISCFKFLNIFFREQSQKNMPTLFSHLFVTIFFCSQKMNSICFWFKI